MILARWRNSTIMLSALLLALLLAGCGGTSQTQTKPTPTPLPPTPTPGQGQQLLKQVANTINAAKTLHGIFNLSISGQSINGTVNSEVWNEAPGKSRTVVLQSSVSQVATGAVTVTDGKQVWQYDPVKKVVYNGPVPTNVNTGGSPNAGGGQSRFLLNLVQNIFRRSNGTLQSSNATINGHTVYDVHVVPQSSAADNQGGGFNYDGEAYIDKTSGLPVRVDLTIPNLGKVRLDLLTLELNQPIAESTFTFTVPAGVKVLPLQQASSSGGTGSLSLGQAQQQAGYHLLSIPSSKTAYVLQGVTALGAPGNQIYTLNYMKGTTSFTIAQGKPLADLPGGTGQQSQQISLRGTTGTLSSENGATTLAWTEQGVGIRITGNLRSDEIVSIAKSLS